MHRITQYTYPDHSNPVFLVESLDKWDNNRCPETVRQFCDAVKIVQGRRDAQKALSNLGI